MKDEEAASRSLAERVADEQPVEWDEALRTASGEKERRMIGHLRLVETVARVHRETGREFGDLSDAATLVETRSPGHGPGGMTGSKWAHLELREKLGEGAYGEVYRAWDGRLDREVALKLLSLRPDQDEALASKAIAEGRLLARLGHPNVVTVHGADRDTGRVGFWMELIRGRTLDQLIDDQGPFGAREASVIGIDLCRALAAVHQSGIIHRDIKAQNVMREEGGRILLTDFGAGTASALDSSRGTLSGTPLYMAPELLKGTPASDRSDIYSLGVLLYFLVTGSFPVEASSWSRLRDRMARQEAVLLRDRRPDLPEGFVAVVERATAWAPRERFASAGELERALAASLGQPSADSPGTRQVPIQRRGLWLGGAGIAAVLIVGLLVLGPRLSGVPDPLGQTSPPVNGSKGAAPATARYTVEAGLYRTRSSGPRERLEPGARLEIGDRLNLEFRASTPLHVYVINEDEAGHAYALFPLPGLELQNPLSGRVTHELPGVRDGTRVSWTVDSPGGREHLMVLASPDRLVEFEAEMSRLARAGEMAVGLPDSVKVRLRGIGGLEASPVTAQGEGAGRLFEMAGALTARPEMAEGVWMRHIELENPAAP